MAACAPSWIGYASGLPDRRANHMGISSDEISSLIKRRIKEFDVPILAADVGIVTEVGDGIAQIYGLQGAQALELLEFKGGVSGIALNLEEDSVGAVILGPYEDIKEGDQVRTTGKIIQVPVGEALVGRVVNALGEPIDGDRKSTRLNSSHGYISYAVFCLKKKKHQAPCTFDCSYPTC